MSHPWLAQGAYNFLSTMLRDAGPHPMSARGSLLHSCHLGDLSKLEVDPCASSSGQQSREPCPFATVQEFLFLTPNGSFWNLVYEPTNTQDIERGELTTVNFQFLKLQAKDSFPTSNQPQVFCYYTNSNKMCTLCVPDAHGDQKRVLDFPEMELWDGCEAPYGYWGET